MPQGNGPGQSFHPWGEVILVTTVYHRGTGGRCLT